ncbi:MAG: hypothetical protein H6726_00400 [Sandaracinaceae bacterium]|nr:hypothetical protein [Sandaracinaceae bacterium]
MGTSTVSVKVLGVDASSRRLRVRVRRCHEDANLPLNRSFFVRMFASLALEIGGSSAIDAALEGKELDDAFIDTSTWRFIAGYTEVPGETGDDREYEVTVTDPAWLDGLAPGMAFDTADYSTWPDEVTEEENARIPQLRRYLRLDLDTPEVLALDVCFDGRLLAVLGDGPSVTVFDTTSWEKVRELRELERASDVRFVPATTYLVSSAGERAIDARTGEPLDRAVALGEWKPQRELEGHLWTTASLDGARRVVFGSGETVALTDGAGMVLRELPVCDFPRLSADGRVLVASGDRALEVWDTTSDAPPRLIPLRDYCIGLALSPDGAFALTFEGEYRHAYVRRLTDGEVVRYGNAWHDRRGKTPHEPLWSHDGRFVVISQYTSNPRTAWLEIYQHER